MLTNLILNTGFEKLAAPKTIYRSSPLGSMQLPYDINNTRDMQQLNKHMAGERKWNAAMGGLGLGSLGAIAGHALGQNTFSAGAGALVGAGAGMLLGYGASSMEQSMAKDLMGIKDPNGPIPSRVKTSQSNPPSWFSTQWLKKNLTGINPFSIQKSVIKADKKENNAGQQLDDVINYAPWALGGLAVGGLGYGGYKAYQHLTKEAEPKKKSIGNPLLETQKDLAWGMGLPTVPGLGRYLDTVAAEARMSAADKAKAAASGRSVFGFTMPVHLAKSDTEIRNAAVDLINDKYTPDSVAEDKARDAYGDFYANKWAGRAALLSGTVAGTYLGDRNLRSAAFSGAGSLLGSQLVGNLALAGNAVYNASKGRLPTSDQRKTQATIAKVLMMMGAVGGGAGVGYLTRQQR